MTTADTAKTITASLRQEFGLKCSRSKYRYGSVWNALAIAVNAGWVSNEVRTAMYGIDWARSTGRLPAEAEMAIRAMNDWQMCELIGNVAANCLVSGAVPRFLIQTFCGKTG